MKNWSSSNNTVLQYLKSKIFMSNLRIQVWQWILVVSSLILIWQFIIFSFSLRKFFKTYLFGNIIQLTDERLDQFLQKHTQKSAFDLKSILIFLLMEKWYLKENIFLFCLHWFRWFLLRILSFHISHATILKIIFFFSGKFNLSE